MPRAALFLMLLMSGLASGAEPEVPASDTAEDSEADASATTEDIDATLAEEIRAAEEAAAAAPPADANEPFIPSVQISEDLSVSFPVDI